MIELESIGFDWDAGNKRKSEEKHGVSQADAEQVFFNAPLLVLGGIKHSVDEQRYHALGKSDENRLLHISFSIRNGKIRVISARRMHRKEKKHYENNT